MYENKHKDEAKHQYWINKEISDQLDEILKKEGYKSRTEWYREQIRNKILKNK